MYCPRLPIRSYSWRRPSSIGILGLVLGLAICGMVRGYSHGKPRTFAEGLVPGWGPGRMAGYCLAHGSYFWGTCNGLLAVADAFLCRSLVLASWQVVGELGWGAILPRPGRLDLLLTADVPFHCVWGAEGRWYHAAGEMVGRLKVAPVPRVDLGQKVVEFGLGEEAPIICGPVSLPVLNPHLVGRGRLGAYSVTCVGEAAHAWSCGNYHVLYWVGGRGLKEAGYGLVRHHRLRVRLLAKHEHHGVRLCGAGETVRMSRPQRRHHPRTHLQHSRTEPRLSSQRGSDLLGSV